jgi:hypothetical protein
MTPEEQLLELRADFREAVSRATTRAVMDVASWALIAVVVYLLAKAVIRVWNGLDHA